LKKNILYVFVIILIGTTIKIISSIGNHLGFYETYWFFDEIFHFIGGIWAGLTSLLVLHILSQNVFRIGLSTFCIKYTMANIVVFMIFGTMFIAVLWEVLEYLVQYNMTFPPDTNTDIAMGIVGGLTILRMYFFYFFYKKNRMEIIV